MSQGHSLQADIIEPNGVTDARHQLEEYLTSHKDKIIKTIVLLVGMHPAQVYSTLADHFASDLITHLHPTIPCSNGSRSPPHGRKPQSHKRQPSCHCTTRSMCHIQRQRLGSHHSSRLFRYAKYSFEANYQLIDALF